MSNLLSLRFWFNLRPGPLLPIYQKLFIAFLIFLILASFVFWLTQNRQKKVYRAFWKRLHTFSLVNAFLGFVLLFFNYELVPFLSARFWFLVWGAGILVWLFFIFRILFKIPEKRKKLEAEKEYKKYIP